LISTKIQLEFSKPSVKTKSTLSATTFSPLLAQTDLTLYQHSRALENKMILATPFHRFRKTVNTATSYPTHGTRRANARQWCHWSLLERTQTTVVFAELATSIGAKVRASNMVTPAAVFFLGHLTWADQRWAYVVLPVLLAIQARQNVSNYIVTAPG